MLSGTYVEDDPTKKYSFKVVGDHLSRIFELTADTTKDKENWMAILDKATKAKPGSAAALKSAEFSSQGSTMLYGGKENIAVTVDDFDFLKTVGRGSFGKVMKVRYKPTGEIYAMKILRKEMIIKENMVSHTKAEKTILQQVDHPFIVSLVFAFQTEEKLYLVLDFLAGGELFFHLKEETKFTLERSKFYAAEIVLAIEHLHKHDIIYRDLKPENVVLDKDGHICLTDFGLAKTCISNATPTYTFCGTPEYLAPEILKGQGHGKAVDWWSLGVLLYEMLVGLPPFYSENINEMYELILKAPLKFPNFVPADAQSLLRGLLEREEFKRLGGTIDGEEIKSHAFFKDVDWEKLYNREIKPPFIPDLVDNDTKYFDEEFTGEKPVDSFAEVAEDGSNADFSDWDHLK